MKQMPKDTILLKMGGGEKAVAYEYDYFKNNFQSSTTRYDAIYYKAGKTRDTWIDYKRAIQVKSGSKADRIAQALADEDFLINVELIPSCFYYATGGYREYYTPYDGYYDNSMWLKRIDDNMDYDSITYTWDGDDLLVKFPSSIANAIISLNMMFYQYEEKDNFNIIYRGIKSKISEYYGMDGNVRNTYFLKFNVYQWENLTKQKVITPIRKENDKFLMPVEMEQNAFIIYNNVLYTYEVSTANNKYITINGINMETFPDAHIDEILVYRMVSDDPEMEARMYTHTGINNRYKNSVDFLLPVSNSLIVYNGLDHEYTVEDDNAIAYPQTIYSVNSVSNQSSVLSINFIKG